MLGHGDLTKTGSICHYHETTKNVFIFRNLSLKTDELSSGTKCLNKLLVIVIVIMYADEMKNVGRNI